MNLMGGRPKESPAATPPSRPRDDSPCECGSNDFTPGGSVVHPWHDGVTCGIEIRGEILSCLKCGSRWYQTHLGLKKPHEAALPPAWALRDLQARATRQVANGDPDKGKTKFAPKRGIAEEYARPPRPV